MAPRTCRVRPLNPERYLRFEHLPLNIPKTDRLLVLALGSRVIVGASIIAWATPYVNLRCFSRLCLICAAVATGLAALARYFGVAVILVGDRGLANCCSCCDEGRQVLQ
jgi:hypothetical protein